MLNSCKNTDFLIETEDDLREEITRIVAEKTKVVDGSFSYSYGGINGVQKQYDLEIGISEVEVDVSGWIDEDGNASKNISDDLPKKEIRNEIHVSGMSISFEAVLKRLFVRNERIIAIYLIWQR